MRRSGACNRLHPPTTRKALPVATITRHHAAGPWPQQYRSRWQLNLIVPHAQRRSSRVRAWRVGAHHEDHIEREPGLSEDEVAQVVVVAAGEVPLGEVHCSDRKETR